MCRTPNVARDRQADLGGGVQLSCLTRDRPLNCREAEPAGKAARTQGSQHRGRVVHPETLLHVEPPSCTIPSDLTVRGAQIPFHETDDCLAKIDPGGRQVSSGGTKYGPQSFSIEVTSANNDPGRAMSAPTSALEHAAKVSIRISLFDDKILEARACLIIQHAAWLYVQLTPLP